MKAFSKIFQASCLAIGLTHAVATSAVDASGAPTSVRAAEMLGMDIRNPAGEKLGDVKKLFVDVPAGRVNSVLVSPVAASQPAINLVQVLPNELSLSGDAKFLVMNSGRNLSKLSSTADTPNDARILKGGGVIGMAVVNGQGDKLGEVRDFALDLRSGKIIYVGLSAGGIFGIGDKLIGGPARTFSLFPGEK